MKKSLIRSIVGNAMCFVGGFALGTGIKAIATATAVTLTNNPVGRLGYYVLCSATGVVLAIPAVKMAAEKITDWVFEARVEEAEQTQTVNNYAEEET